MRRRSYSAVGEWLYMTSQNSNPVSVAVFPFAGIPKKVLKEWASPILPVSGRPRQGKSEDRLRAHYAGRCAAQYLLRKSNLATSVIADFEWGYLKVVEKDSQKQIKDCFLNISHTDEVAVAVVAHSPVGVDVESIDRSAERVLPRVASQEEIAAVQASSWKNNIYLWSAKEAFSKALGIGMNFGLQDFQIFLDHNRLKTTRKGPMALEDPGLAFQKFDRYLIAICTEKKLLQKDAELFLLKGSDFPTLR